VIGNYMKSGIKYILGNRVKAGTQVYIVGSCMTSGTLGNSLLGNFITAETQVCTGNCVKFGRQVYSLYCTAHCRNAGVHTRVHLATA
jgi:hypothetical protein